MLCVVLEKKAHYSLMSKWNHGEGRGAVRVPAARARVCDVFVVGVL